MLARSEVGYKMLICQLQWRSQVARVVKNPPARARDLRDTGSIPGSGRSPGEGNGSPLQYSGESHGQRSLVDYTVHEVAESQT